MPGSALATIRRGPYQTLIARVDGESGTVIKILLVLPFIGLLWVPFYNQTEPSLFGFPFFYWYQILWVPVSSLLTYLVWRATRGSSGS